MRFLKLNLIAAAMLILGVGSASAYSVSMTSNYLGGILQASDTVTVTVKFDTEGALALGSPSLPSTRLLMLGVGVMFDESVLAYDMAASSAVATVIDNPLTSPAANASDFAVASSCPAGYPSYVPQCGLWPAPPAQVQLDFISTGLGNGFGVPTNTAPGGNVLATLVFHVIGAGDGLGEINLHFSPARGSVLQIQSRANASTAWTYSSLTPTLGAGVAVLVPEPTTAVLVGLGLAGLGVAGRRRE